MSQSMMSRLEAEFHELLEVLKALDVAGAEPRLVNLRLGGVDVRGVAPREWDAPE